MSTPSMATRSRRKTKQPVDKAEDQSATVLFAEEERSGDKKRGRKRASRELRRKTREGLRSRALGVGLVIPSEKEQSSSKHVVFGEEDVEVNSGGEEVQVEVFSEEQRQGEDELGNEDDDDDDDAVEEVKSNIARDQAMHQRAMERETAKVQKLQSTTKKRKKTKETLEAEEEFDDEFFSQVDSEMASHRQRLRVSEKQQQSMGRHTTFVSAYDEATDRGPIHTDHNIELVVLGGDDAENESTGGGYEGRLHSMGVRMGTQPSESALIFSRNRLFNGDDQPSKKTRKKKETAAKRLNEKGWKRSKKMNRLASSRAKAHRRGGRGVPAAHFVKKI